MSQEKIARLQDLLERVQMRAGEPRAARPEGAAAAAFAPSPAPMAAPPLPRTPPPPAPEASFAPTTEPEVDHADDEMDGEMDVEVSSEVVEVDIDVDEAGMGGEMESGAQPIAHATQPPADLEELTEDVPIPTNREAQDAEPEMAHASAANEIEEPAPSSSPRPIEAETAPEAYEEESAPRHTPPPESGKQVAAAPSTHPPRESMPSAPPPSLEGGRTLIGGWREPGIPPEVRPAAGTAPAVRVPAPPPSAPAAPPPAAQHAPPAPSAPQVAAPPPSLSGTRLSPDVTRPNLPAGAKVAAFEGAAPVAKPATFGDLLDMTLGL